MILEICIYIFQYSYLRANMKPRPNRVVSWAQPMPYDDVTSLNFIGASVYGYHFQQDCYELAVISSIAVYVKVSGYY